MANRNNSTQFGIQEFAIDFGFAKVAVKGLNIQHDHMEEKSSEDIFAETYKSEMMCSNLHNISDFIDNIFNNAETAVNQVAELKRKQLDFMDVRDERRDKFRLYMKKKWKAFDDSKKDKNNNDK